MPEYPRSPLRKVGDIVCSRVSTDTLEMIDNMYYGVSWDGVGSACVRTGALKGVAASSSLGNALLPIQAAMRRCVINDDGVLQYYLDPLDSTQKVGGAASTLTGADGQVMVEIPLFYYRYSVVDSKPNWDVSPYPIEGFSIHPAFIAGSEVVQAIYLSAYEGSMWDKSTGAMVPSGSIATNMYAAGDKLCSFSGEYPKTNETRADYRAMSDQRSLGWSQLDFDVNSMLQLLYLTEYADFDSQTVIGPGRTQLSGGSWVADSYIGQCGKSNVDGNGTNSVGGNTNNAYMTYRGIENWYGNVWKLLDGININTHVPYVSNNPVDYQDDTTDNYTPLNITLPNADNYQQTLHQQDRGFMPATVGADVTKITDYYWQASGWRVVRLGGNASIGAHSGAFSLYAGYASLSDDVHVGGRLIFKPITRDTKDYKHPIAITNDTTWSGSVPMGYEIEKILFVNSTANVATLDLGTTIGGNDIFINQAIAANDITTVVINKTPSMSVRSNLYLNDDDAGSSWNSASLTAIILMRRVLI